MVESHSTAMSGSPATEADFERLYKVELPRVFNFFRFWVADDQLAENLTSATFEKAWRNRHRYNRDLAAFSTWLFTIARRVSVDHYRRHRAQTSLDEASRMVSAENTEETVQRNGELERLSTLLGRLAERERDLIALKYGAGLTNRKIASLTGLSESNVGVILHRALHLIRAEWEVSR